MSEKRILDDLVSGRLSRRNFGRALAAAGVGFAVMPVLSRPARAAEEATIFTWAGYDRPELYQAYTEKHGSPPEIAVFAQEEEALQKLRAGFQADVLHPCTYSVPRWRDAGALQPVDTSRLTHWPDIWDKLKTIRGTVFDDQHWFVPFDWGNASVVYRTDLVGQKYQEDESWAILYDPEYKGRLSIFDGETACVGVGALVAGFDNPWTLSDEQLATVKDVMAKQRDLLRFYWDSKTVLVQAMAAGELVAAYAWNDAVVDLKRQGVPVKYMNPKEGIFTWVCGLTLSANPPGDPQAAYDVINAMTAPEAGEFLIKEYGLGHSNRKSFDRVPKERLEEIGISSPADLFAQGVFLEPVAPKLKQKYITAFNQAKAGL